MKAKNEMPRAKRSACVIVRCMDPDFCMMSVVNSFYCHRSLLLLSRLFILSSLQKSKKSSSASLVPASVPSERELEKRKSDSGQDYQRPVPNFQNQAALL